MGKKKQPMVLDYDGCFPEAVGHVDGVDVERGKRGEEKASLSDGMGSMTDQFLAVLGRAVVKPSCNASRKDALYGVSVKVGVNLVRNGNIPWSSKKIEALVCFPGYKNVVGPAQIIDIQYMLFCVR